MDTNEYYLGKCDGYSTGIKCCKAYLIWELSACEHGPVFSAQSEVWNQGNTDIIMGGQCVDAVAALFPHNKFAQRFAEVWRLYHRNDTTAGLPEQEAAIKSWEAALKSDKKIVEKYGYPDGSINYYAYCGDHYTGAVKHLKSVGLYEVKPQDGAKAAGGFPDDVVKGLRGYRYGERWVYSEIPADVLAEIRSWSGNGGGE